MQTQEAFTIKKYIDREAIENNLHHSILFVYFSKENIKMVIASKSKNAVFGLSVLELKENVFEKKQTEIISLIDALDIDKKEFSSVKIIIENNCHTLVPEALFVAEKAESFLKLNTSLQQNHLVLFNRLQKNMVSIFALNKDFYSTIKSIFPQAEIIHETELLLQLFYSSNQKENKDNLFVYVHETYIEIAHIKNNELFFFNSFKVEADTDIVYFILSIAELLKLNQEKLYINLFGNISNTSSLVGFMKKYISHVELMKRSDNFSYPASFREFQDQQNYLQVNSLLCAS